MTTEKRSFVLSKPLGALVIVLLAGAFFAGTRASREIGMGGEALAAPRGTPEIATAGFAAPVMEAVTAEQVRRLMLDMQQLQMKLDETIKQVGELNVRLARIEAAQH